MNPKEYLEKFFATRTLPVTEKNRRAFDDFCNESQYLDAVTSILSLQHMLMKQWEIRTKVDNITQQPVRIPNASVNKPYEARLLFDGPGWEDLDAYELQLPEDSGLAFDKEKGVISGVPAISGDLRITMRFRITEQAEDSDWFERNIPLSVNPDPKSLWKDTRSDETALYWKPDNTDFSAPLGSRHIVVSSRRGRSHANVGSFRDDDFSCKHFDACGWSVIAVSDGAGSAKYSREGSRIACNSVLQYFEDACAEKRFEALDNLIISQHADADPDIRKGIDQFAQQELIAAAKYASGNIQAEADKAQANLSDFHATLVFTLVKQFDFGYAMLSFGVGDCPAAVCSDGLKTVQPLNTLDVGEFGGGTRFLTMPEIFQKEDVLSRVRFTVVKDFDYLFLMTDGIYDPKFEVEANLNKPEKWQQFLNDLKGDNADGKAVSFDAHNPELAAQLSAWMDFWSPGNHDDRTLAILF